MNYFIELNVIKDLGFSKKPIIKQTINFKNVDIFLAEGDYTKIFFHDERYLISKESYDEVKSLVSQI